jgi:NNP family nitrate/nitrite transporter-like MFS transporter
MAEPNPSFLVNVLFILFRAPDFGQLEAGYYTSIFGFLNIVTRPAGGLFGDLIYRKYGVPGKKYLTLFLAGGQGLISIGIGAYIQNNTSGTYVAATGASTGRRPDLSTVMGLVALLAIFNEMANGANFALVPHCNARSNGVVTGLVGACGSAGGIFFALVFRFHGSTLRTLGMPFYICGGIIVVRPPLQACFQLMFAKGLNLLVAPIKVPKW